MSKIANRDYAALNLSGGNYLQWALDTKIRLRSKGLGDTITKDNNENEKNRYRSISFIRHHLIEALVKTVSMLRLCGEEVMEEELLEKTYTTFHASNMILQQQYKVKGFATYTDLISCLLLAEANNELLLKNSEARPKDPNECNYVQNNKRSHGKGRGGYKGRGRDNYSNGRGNYSTGRKGNHNNRGRGSNYGCGRGSYGRGRGDISKPSYSTKSVCHRCGMDNHWAKNCRTPKHLCELYQESLKNPEAHMVHDSRYDADDDSDIANDDLMDFETSDCLKD
ncbi:uncharacterized protein LOC117125729 [Brassica rapa]|uniref:uncharacterized protein LOC117125729 n=1 Tax=Brassica campestris TaxID=3711 RepID=UPI00142E4797|nr:uncharacterized protein LOC117125729 [Brassica rapa]